MNDEHRLRAQIARARALLVDGEPRKLGNSRLVASYPDRPVVSGTTVPALVTEWRSLDSGLLVPVHADSAGPAPIDLLLVYLTAKEILGFAPPPSLIAEELRRVSVYDVLFFVADILSSFRAPGAARSELDRHYASIWFEGELQHRVTNLLREPKRGLVVPQALLLLAKLALAHSNDQGEREGDPGNIVLALLTITQYLGSGAEHPAQSVVGDTPGPLGREIIANQYFNSPPSEVHLMARFIRRWRQMPAEHRDDPQVIDLAQAYKDATGITLDDLMTVGLALWASAAGGRPHVPAGYFSILNWSSERLDRVLHLLGADLLTLRLGVKEEIDLYGEPGLQWAFSTFERWPVVRLADGSLLVLDPKLLVTRIVGWLPLFDIKAGATSGKRSVTTKTAKQAEQCLRHLSEFYVLEVLQSVAEGSPAQRVYGDAELRAVFRKLKRRVADIVIDYGDAWVVTETTTTQLKRQSVVAQSEEAQVEDLDKLVGEAEQIHATIESLREDESRLTGAAHRPYRKFFPVLVLAEGFPVNPVTLTVLWERLRAKNLLQDPDIAPLEVLDTEELELIEALQEEGGPSLKQILEGKSKSNLSRASVRDYIIAILRRQPSHSRRLESLWLQAVGPVLDTVAEAERKAGPQP